MVLLRRRPANVNAQTPLRRGTDSPDVESKSLKKRNRGAVERDLRRQLAILAARHETGEMAELEVGLILLAHRNTHGSYADWRSCLDRRLRQMKAPGQRPERTPRAWPAQIPEGGWGLILLAVPSGTASMVDRRLKSAPTATRTRRETLLASPISALTTSVRMLEKLTPDLMGMDLVTMLIEETPDHSAPQLAPPILEWVTADCRRTLASEVITWDLPWPVAAPHLG
jgi:hypothetical protein